MKVYNLGDKYKASKKLVRRTKYIKGIVFNQRYKYWDVQKINQEVLIIGIRTLSNGTTTWDDEAGNLYEPTDYFQALLVVSDLHKKPFYILA